MPHPTIMRGYEELQPGMADRIFSMAERAQAAQIEADLAPIRAEAWALRAATLAVAFFPWLALGLAAVLVLTGSPTAGAIAAAVGLGTAGPQIIAATRRPRPPQAPAPKK